MKTNFRRQFALITLFGGLALVLALAFGGLAISRFRAAEGAWEEYNLRAELINVVMVDVNRHLGYGGFIHNFKNLVLRRDLPRYQAVIERNIADLTVDLDQLEGLLKLPENQAAAAQLRATVLEYADKFSLIASMVALGKSSAELDAVVKVDDTKALAAMARLVSHINERALSAEKTAQRSQAEAMRFLQLGGLVIFMAMLGAMVTMTVYLRRIVAAHERIRQTQAHLDTLLDHSPDPMLCVARNGTIVRTNQMAEKFFGYSSFDLLTMTVEQLIPERFRTAHIEQRQGFFAHPENRPMGGKAVLSALTRDGREPNVEISLSYTGEGEKRLSTITIRDVTEQERNRVALVDARQRAEDNLARQRDMQNDLVQAEKMAALGGLVAGVAHEVNTPVGVTLSSATHLEAETRKADALYQAGELTEDGLTDYFATARQAARLMTINSQRASDLIQSFKQVAVDQTGGERRKFNLATYLDEILLSLRPRLKKAPVKVAVACPRDLFVDGFPGALSQVLSNLIMNSLTHAFDPEQAGHIDILARLADAAGEWIEIVYRDDGRGIPPELHTQVFEPFFTTRRGKGGSGLGLHIVSNILRQTLKGTLELDSATGQGTAFTLRFPQNLPR